MNLFDKVDIGDGPKEPSVYDLVYLMYRDQYDEKSSKDYASRYISAIVLTPMQVKKGTYE